MKPGLLLDIEVAPEFPPLLKFFRQKVSYFKDCQAHKHASLKAFDDESKTDR